MEKLLEAIKNNDLVEAKKAFASVMATKTAALIEEETARIAKSFIIEGEEAEDEDEDEGEDEQEGEEKEKKGKKADSDESDDESDDEGEGDEEE